MMEKISSPRPLTGGQAVQESTQKHPFKACVDWVQVTLKGEKNLFDILDIFGLSGVEFMQAEKGYYGYPYMVTFSNISIMWNEMKTEYHIQMTGQACRMFERISTTNWMDLFAWLHADPEAKFTRLDLAIDDFKKCFTIPVITRKMKKGQLVTKFREGETRTKFRFSSDDLGNSERSGDGVVFGSPKSRLMIRMYDKKLERENANFAVTVDSWLRVELQLRKEYANEAVAELVYSTFAVGTIAKGYLKEYIRFVEPSQTDSNKRRWPDSPFWEKYLEGIAPLKLSLAAPDKTIEKSIAWLDHATAPTLAMIYEAKGEAFYNRFVEELKITGKERMKKTHESIVSEHKQNEEIAKQINQQKLNEFKKKMATVRKNRSQKQNEKNNRMVLKKYNMNSVNETNKALPSVLGKKVPRIRLLDDNQK